VSKIDLLGHIHFNLFVCSILNHRSLLSMDDFNEPEVKTEDFNICDY
jgi:hypothetical protein